MSVYNRLKKRQRILLGALVAVFIIVAVGIGPLSNRYSSPLLTVLSFVAIAVFVACNDLFGPAWRALSPMRDVEHA